VAPGFRQRDSWHPLHRSATKRRTAARPDGASMEHLEELLTGQEYARLRRCSIRTVERERSNGSGCRYVKISRAVRYRRRDVLDFIEQHVRHSTSEAHAQ
jgi:hypothetical protein